MPRIDIPVQILELNGKIDEISFTAADAANDHDFINSGNEILLARNETDSPGQLRGFGCTQQVASNLNRGSGDTVVITGSSGNTLGLVGPLPPDAYSTQAGKVNVNLTADVDFAFAVIRIHRVRS